MRGDQCEQSLSVQADDLERKKEAFEDVLTLKSWKKRANYQDFGEATGACKKVDSNQVQMPEWSNKTIKKIWEDLTVNQDLRVLQDMSARRFPVVGLCQPLVKWSVTQPSNCGVERVVCRTDHR